MKPVEKIVEDLQKTTSNNEKESTIENNIDNINFVNLLWWTYNSFVKSFLKEKSLINGHGLEVCGANFDQVASDFFDLYEKLNSRKLSGNDAINSATSLINKCSKDTAIILKNSLLGDLRAGIAEKTINKILKRNQMKEIPVFNIQHANQYDPNKNYKVEYFYATPKLDGLRCVYVDGQLYTRKGKEIVGFEHIRSQCEDLANEFDLNLIDGELYSDNLQFQRIQSVVMKRKDIDEEEKRTVYLNIFAVYRKESISNPEMNEIIEFINIGSLRGRFSQLIGISSEIIDNNSEKIKTKCREYYSQGYEGIMLRNPNVPYDFKRSDSLLKYKDYKEDDFEVIEVLEGTGRNKGRLGSFVVEGSYNGYPVQSNVGSGFSDKERDQFWKEKDKCIRKLIEVQFQELTDEKNEESLSWSLKFPRFSKFKLDR